jgi:recombination protein RecA
LEKSGAWYAYRGERIGQGRENAKQYFRENPVAAKELEEEIMTACGLAKKEKEAEKGGEKPPTPKK